MDCYIRTMEEKQVKYILCKAAFITLLHMPNFFFRVLFSTVFPVYKARHIHRAYGRCETHLRNASSYIQQHLGNVFCQNLVVKTSASDVFKGIFWNAIDSYRGLAHFSNTTSRIVYENENVIQEALTLGPVAALSIHQGAFELLHRSLCRYSNNVHLVTDTLGNGCLRTLIQELRSDPHLTEYSPDQSRALIRNLFETKGILAMVFDQGKNTKGNKVKLFGQNSTLYLRLPELVNQMGAGIVTFRTFTRPRGIHKMRGDYRGDIVVRFETYYPPHYDKIRTEINAKNCSIQNESDAPLVESIAKEVETWISENPAQWSWNYHGNFRA